jgi:dynein heavy chain
MRNRHWEQMSEMIGYPFRPNDDTNLVKIIEMNLLEFIPKFEGISEAASKEFSLEKALDKMKKEWKDIEFTVIPYRETGTFIISLFIINLRCVKCKRRGHEYKECSDA